MPNFRKLQDDSKNVSLKIGSRVPQKFVSGTGSAWTESEEKGSFTTNMAFSSLTFPGLYFLETF